MSKTFRVVLAFTFVALASPASAGELKVTLNNGLATVIADEVPVSRILAEWARVGQTTIVNGDKLMTVVSLQLVDIPEKKALDIILRSASGYMAAQRATPAAGTSAFDRIMILPFSKPPAPAPVPAVTSMPQPFSPPRPVMQPQIDADDPVMQPGVNPPPPPGQGPQTAPMPGMLPPPNGPQTGQPAQPQTLPRPGFLPAPPGAPQQPVPFGSPTVPGKPPGGGRGGGPGAYEPDRD